ncbi:MAG: hypothetical protein HC773_05570 [Scytonema sp. CRU_2_7]|nr:hypothetical protein [Scytonema sp. CRU_2_7]
MPLQPGFTLRRYETKVLRYDSDFGNQLLLRFRIQKDEDGITRTPITPSLIARLIDLGDCKAPRSRKIEPRQVEACFANPVNDSGESRLTLFVPYRPVDQSSHIIHIREIRDYAGVAAISYQGEISERI